MKMLNRRWQVKIVFIVLFVFLFSGCASAEPLFNCSFAKGGWDPNEWTLVKSPRWDHFGSWVQRDLYIENQTPADAEPADLTSKPHAAETYTSMVLKKQFTGRVTISATMEFTDRMAPLIVISSELGEDKKGRTEYREHYEIVLFEKGVNIWHHYFKNGKPYWKKAAYSHFSLKPNIQYKIKVKISPTPKGKILSVFVAGQEFGYIDDSLPNKFYVGITGCEGINRFYDFAVEKEK